MALDTVQMHPELKVAEELDSKGNNLPNYLRIATEVSTRMDKPILSNVKFM